MQSGKKQRRKNRQPSGPSHGHDEETWLVSYADMMTLLFGFFVILYSFSTLDEKKFKEVSKDMQAALGKKAAKNELKDDGAQLLSEEQEKLKFMTLLVSMMNMGSMDDVMAKVQKKADRDAVAEAARGALEGEFQESKEKIFEVVLPADTLFKGNGTELTPAGLARLKTIAARVKRVEDVLDVSVETHADESDTARGRTNLWVLTASRSGAVAEALAQQGVDRKKIHTGGFAAVKPLFPAKTPNGVPIAKNRAKNRRVHVILKRVNHGGQ